MEEGDKRVKHRFTPWRRSIEHNVIFSLTLIVLTCIISVVILTGLIILNLPDTGYGERSLNLDVIMAIFAQIASTATGALVGYFSARVAHQITKQGSKEIGTPEGEEGE